MDVGVPEIVALPCVQDVRETMECSVRESARVKSLCRRVDVAEDRWTSYSQLFVELKKTRQALEDLSSQELYEKLQYSESKEKKLFEQLLGLEIKRNEDETVSFEFTHLVANEPHLTCSVKMDVNTQNQWEVLSVAPPIKGVAGLLEELNKTQSLAVFCKNIRTAFKKSLAQKTPSTPVNQ